jgi:hypothetical protein
MEYSRIRLDGEALVVAFDMCSSSSIMEQLLLAGDMSCLTGLLTAIKQRLAVEQKTVPFDPYKFTGDGWILFPIRYRWCSTHRVLGTVMPVLSRRVSPPRVAQSDSSAKGGWAFLWNRPRLALVNADVRAARVHWATIEHCVPPTRCREGQRRVACIQSSNNVRCFSEAFRKSAKSEGSKSKTYSAKHQQ